MEPNWNVQSEKKHASSYVKKEIIESNITRVNQPSNDTSKIRIPHKNYEESSNNSNQIHLNDFQQAFNRNPSRNLETKDEVSFSNPKKNQEYKPIKGPQRIDSSQIKNVNNIKNLKRKSRSPYNKGNANSPNMCHSNILQNINYKEDLSLINYFSEVFPRLDRSVISKFIKENSDVPEEKLFDILSDLMPAEESQSRSQGLQRAAKDKNQFKKNLCLNTSECINPNCEFYHSQGERRRLLDDYSSQMCRNDKCEAHEACPNAHTLSEIFFHSNFYKKLPCPFKECPLKHLCRFSHGHLNQANGLGEKLQKTIEELHLEKKNLMETNSKTNEEIRKLALEKEMLKNRLVCSLCLKYRIEYVSVPCSHRLCGKCIEEVGDTKKCFKCNALMEVLKIDYN